MRRAPDCCDARPLSEGRRHRREPVTRTVWSPLPLSEQTNPDRGPEPAPSWLISQEYDDVDLGLLKEGKEATCSLVERRARDDGRTHLLVAKRYRDVKQRAFRNDAMYRHRTGNSHMDKAILKRTDLGLAIQEHVRAEREFDVLCALWSAALPVPYPIWRFGTELHVEFIGDDGIAAPRLVAARLDAAAAAEALHLILDACADMLAMGWVHGDLSPYNVLWHHDRPVLIDFPQTMDLGTHPMALDVLHRDIVTMCRWARRRGATPPDPDEAFASMLSRQYG